MVCMELGAYARSPEMYSAFAALKAPRHTGARSYVSDLMKRYLDPKDHLPLVTRGLRRVPEPGMAKRSAR